MKYLGATFSGPTCTVPISQLEYDLRVGKIDEAQYLQKLNEMKLAGRE